MSVENIKRAIRDIPDFPQPGVIFKDITPLLNRADLFREAIDLMGEEFAANPPGLIACVEARGFILGSALAYKLGAGLVPVRKEGKLPHKTRKASFELEYGKATVEVHEDAILPGVRVLIVDDVLATGGTLAATVDMVEGFGAKIVGISVLIELDFLGGRKKISRYPLYSLIHY